MAKLKTLNFDLTYKCDKGFIERKNTLLKDIATLSGTWKEAKLTGSCETSMDGE